MKKVSKIYSLLIVALFLVLPVLSFAEEPLTNSDQCANIAGTQLSVPSKYYQESGNCYIAHVNGQPDTKNPDYCLNIDGVQTALPTPDHFRNDRGNCVVPADVCPNLAGIQGNVPKNYALLDGSCVSTLRQPNEGGSVPTVVDMCLNIPSTQTSVPEKYYQESGNCYISFVQGQPSTKNPDYCLNIAGMQTYLPEGYTFRNDRGNCVMPTVKK